MANFPAKPTLSRGESPSLYSNNPISVSVKAEAEGGYEFRRPRTTRARRRQIETGFIGLPHVDYLTLVAFEETHTDVVPFTYFDYMHGVYRQVRFDEFKPDYKGVGTNRIWDIKIKMSEV